MKIRNKHNVDSVELHMTPMIDIVFQLLAFFIMTFKVVAMEGDFEITMPLASDSQVTNMDMLDPTIVVRMYAAPDGSVDDIVVNDTHRFGSDFNALSQYIRDYVSNSNAGDFEDSSEVEFDCDYDLRYEEVIQAVTAVTGYKKPDGEIVTLIEKVRFKDNGQSGE